MVQEPAATSPAFFWGSNGNKLSADQVRNRRQVVDAMLSRRSAPQSLGAGLSYLGETIAGMAERNRLDQAESEGRALVAQAMADAQASGSADGYMSVLGDDWASPGQQQVAQASLNRIWGQEDQAAEWAHDQSLVDQKAALPMVINDQLVRMGDDGPTVLGDYRSPKAPDLPAAVDEYNWYAEQEQAGGRQPMSYLDFVQAQKGNGLSITTPDGTVISQGGGKYNQTVSGGFGEAFMGIQNQALSAVQGMGTLDAMEQAMADPNFYSGFGAEQLMGLKQAAAAMGINPDGVQSMETFNALSKKAALDAMGGSLGAGFSNADRGFVEQQVASLGSTPEGNRALIGLQRKLAERKIEVAQLANQYAQAKGGIDAGFTDFLAQWAEDNPLFSVGAGAGVGTTNTTGSGLKWSVGQ